MSNTIKYSESTEQRALNKGNWYIGTGDVNKGPSDVTGYYAGVTPPSSGYTIYTKREDDLPSIFVAQNDQELIFLTNQISESNFTTTQECLNYFQSQDDKLCVNREIENIVTDGLILNLDAGYIPSYPQSGTTWYDLSGNGNNGTLVNGPTYSGGSISFDGTNEYLNFSQITFTNQPFTLEFWGLINNFNSRRTIFIGGFPGELSANYVFFTLINLDGVNSSRNFGSAAWPYLVPTGVPFQWNFIFYPDRTATFSVNGNLNPLDNDDFSQYTNVEFKFNGFGRNASRPYYGDLYNMKIYNKDLTSSEILQNYNAQKGRFGL